MDSKVFLSVLCLIRNEQKLLREFVPYYLSQGVDQIYFLDDRSTAPYDDFITQHPNIQFIKLDTANVGVPTLNHIKSCIQKVYLQIRNQTTWLIVVDADEFITTRLNKTRTIRDELETTFKHADCVKIPWVMFGSSGNQKTPESILKSCIYRWNYDKQHIHPYRSHKHQCRYKAIEVKCIIKPDKFLCISGSPHHPTNPINPNHYIAVNSVNGRLCKLNPFHSNLRNKDICHAILTCNHYRYYSREFMQQKCNAGHIDKQYVTKNALRDMLAADYNEILDTSISSKIEGPPNCMVDRTIKQPIARPRVTHGSIARTRTSRIPLTRTRTTRTTIVRTRTTRKLIDMTLDHRPRLAIRRAR